ncbi:MAG: acetate kinase [Erysipelotrichales bacterium]|nr:acetate kinase [Erysipelotrichales bacterium]
MTKVISVNAGSSSLKFQLYNMPEEEVLCSGQFERIGLEDGIFTIKVNGEKHVSTPVLPDHEVAVDMLLKALVDYKVVESLDEIKGAGHRVVQGGAYFDGSVECTDDSAAKVKELAELAPLHNNANLGGYLAFKKALPNCGNIFVFDTAFHQTMTPESYMYAVPYEWYTDLKVRRYGAHGTSHKYVAERTAELMGKDVKDLKIITCHLGNGASITAVDGGKCVNTSMGFTPLGGIMMGTRCGDIDPAIVPYVMKKTGMTPQEMDTALNKKSGMLGVSGISSDARDIEAAVQEGNERAILTRAIYVNRVINVIGGYYMQMGGVDAIAFTAGLGENDVNLRHEICEKLEAGLGIKMNYELNDTTRGKEVEVSTADSKVAVWIVPTNEELMIARDTVRILGL